MPPEQIGPEKTKLELVTHAEDIVAKVDKDAFRAMFYLFAGKPDSKYKTYDGKIVVIPEELKELNRRVHEKFRLHNIPQVVTNASVSLDKN